MIMKLLDQGIEKFRDLFFILQKECDLTSSINHSILQKFVILPFPINWKLSVFGIISTVDLTVNLRYVNWHFAHFRGSDCDLSYEPSEPVEDPNA